MRILIPLVLAAAIVGGSFSADASAKTPDCSGIENWPTSMAFVHMKNAGITDNNRLDFTKTKTIRLVSEKIGIDLYRQIHLVTYMQKDGRPLVSITISDASHEECSMGNVQVFVVSQQLGDKPQAPY